MRRDAWTARTWILAVVAGWSLLVAVLAMFGLGGRITPLPADPDLVQPLPRLPAAPPERLGPLPQYAMVGERPLFSEDRRPKPFVLSGEEAAAPAYDLVLSSVLLTPRQALAIVQPAQGGTPVKMLSTATICKRNRALQVFESTLKITGVLADLRDLLI